MNSYSFSRSQGDTASQSALESDGDQGVCGVLFLFLHLISEKIFPTNCIAGHQCPCYSVWLLSVIEKHIKDVNSGDVL